MRETILVFLGGGLGAVGRYAVGSLLLPLMMPFPLATFLVNVTGCLVMGGVFAWLSSRPDGAALWAFFATGLLGGFTTFSAFGLDVFKLWQAGYYPLAFAYILASVTLSLLAVGLGFWLVKVLG